MMNSLKHARKNIGHGLSRTWDHISEGWRELVHQSGDALTHFAHRKDEEGKEHSATGTLPETGAYWRERLRKRTKRWWCG